MGWGIFPWGPTFSVNESAVSAHMSHIRIRNKMLHMRTYVTNCYVCVQLYPCVTHGNFNVLRLRTTVRICNMWIS